MRQSFLLFLLLPGSLAAGEPSPLRFAIETQKESRHHCKLLAMEADGTLRVEQTAARLTLPGLVAMRQENQALPPLPTHDFVLLTSGDCLPLDPDACSTLEANRLFVWPAKSLPGVHEQGLPLNASHVVLQFWTLPEGVEDAELFYARLAGGARKNDVVYLKNGDRVEGTITALGAKTGCTLTSGKLKVQTPWSKLAGISWSTERQIRLESEKPHFRAVLAGGGRMTYSTLRFEEKVQRWIGTTLFGATLDLPASGILALCIRRGPAAYLSDLTPTRYASHPYLGISWPLAKDAAVTGHPLRLHDNTYEKGLGMHASSEAAYKLNGEYERFEALVGLDVAIARRGRVRLAVLLDGKRVDLNEGKDLTSSDAPLQVRLDVRGVRELTLMVSPGSFGDVQAHVNWTNARLINREK